MPTATAVASTSTTPHSTQAGSAPPPSSDTKMPTDSLSSHSTSTTKHSTPAAPTNAHPVSSAHPTASHPPAPPPKSTSQSHSATHIASAISPVTVVKGTPTQTSTVTAQANSTFSTPVAITTVNGAGAKVVTTPPLVTVISTSTRPDGLPVTVTHVVANPTGSDDRNVSQNGFFHNQGAVAGVFVVVGIAIAAVLAGLIFCIRAQRRRSRRRRWLAGMQQQRLSLARDPFQDPAEQFEQRGSPMMRSVGSGREDLRWDGNSGTQLLPEQPAPQAYHNAPVENGNFLLYPDPYPLSIPNNMVQNHYGMQNVDLGHLEPPNRAQRRHSFTPSSPSIYPATLPADDDERHHEAEERISKLMKREFMHVPPITVPPRPPRSQLRESAKNIDYAPLTPPASVVSYPRSQPPSPISPVTESYPQEFLTRRTILDVRQRTNAS